ncbi:MAG: preprotein translocase subunit SecG [Clostridiales bacterium]|nr:preprotein translocase subunit SecG [Clostridiales bacterium]
MVIVINILLILVALVIIVAVLMQQGNRAGLGAIGGGAETFFGKSKAKSIEAKLSRITKIAAVVFIALAIACTILTARISNIKEASKEAIALEDVVTEEAAEETEEEPATEEAAEPAAEEAAETTAQETEASTEETAA